MNFELKKTADKLRG